MALVIIIICICNLLVSDELDLCLLVLLFRIFDRRANQDADTSLRERKKIRSQLCLESAMKNWITLFRKIAIQCQPIIT